MEKGESNLIDQVELLPLGTCSADINQYQKKSAYFLNFYQTTIPRAIVNKQNLSFFARTLNKLAHLAIQPFKVILLVINRYNNRQLKNHCTILLNSDTFVSNTLYSNRSEHPVRKARSTRRR